MQEQIGIITQARMTSTRLPGKILRKIGGRTLLDYHVSRLKRAGWPVVVATTTNGSDQPVVEYCENNNIPLWRGSEDNVLERFYGAAKNFNFTQIVRVTSDCPLIDGEFIKQSYLNNKAQITPLTYLSNCLKRTYARGFDFEIFSFSMLAEMMAKATQNFEREHVTPYIWKTYPEKFQFIDIIDKENNSDLRITVDEPADFSLIERLILEFKAQDLVLKQITELLKNHAELREINRAVAQKKV